MMRAAAEAMMTHSTTVAKTFAAPARPRSTLLHLVVSFGLFGLFFIAIVDSSFVPLPLPGITDIMLIVFAARHDNIALLFLAAAAGSVIGGYLSYRIGHRGGMAFLEKRVSRRTLNLVRDWMENHAVLAVALPALLPPPMPLSPFVLVAGALKMSRKKFLTTFTISRGLRHALAIWLGVHYGRHILRLWNRLSAQYAVPIRIALWVILLTTATFAVLKLYKTSRSLATPHDVTNHTSTAT